MNWFKTKVDKADALFSKYVRLNALECVVCHRKGTGKDGITGLQLSHYHSRRKESVRFDLENCDSLCIGCHKRMGTDNRREYDEFKLKQLGQKRLDLLNLRANTYMKKDRKLQEIYWKEALKKL